MKVKCKRVLPPHFITDMCSLLLSVASKLSLSVKARVTSLVVYSKGPSQNATDIDLYSARQLHVPKTKVSSLAKAAVELLVLECCSSMSWLARR